MRCYDNDRESNIPICLRSVEAPTHIYNIISSTNEIRSANSLPLMKNITNNEQKDCIIHNSKVTLKLDDINKSNIIINNELVQILRDTETK